MSGPIVVRPAEAADVPGIIALVKRVLAEFDIPFGVGSVTDDQLLGVPAVYTDVGGAFWVGVGDAGVIGTCGVYPVDGGAMELRKMYLAPETRGLGLGKRLLNEVVAFTRAAGAPALVLDTTRQMTEAIAFYEKAGFVRDDTQIRGARCNVGYRLDL